MAGLADLLQRRRTLQRRIAELTREMDGIDRVLFPRIEAMVSAAEGLSLPVEIPTAERHEKQMRDQLQGDEGEAVDEANGVSFIVSRRLRQLRNRLAHSGDLSADDRDVLRRAAMEIEERTSFSDVIVGAVIEMLANRREPMRTAEIHTELVKRGLFVPGKNPINNLSAHLSNRDSFVSTPRGWTLRNPQLVLARGLRVEVTDSDSIPAFLRRDPRSDD